MQSIPVFLKIDGTTCTILRQSIDPAHELGASPGNFAILSEGVICSLDRTQSIGKIFGGSGREISEQGSTESETFKLITLSTEDINSGDRVVDVDEVEYEVTSVIPFPTHKEATLVKR